MSPSTPLLAVPADASCADARPRGSRLVEAGVWLTTLPIVFALNVMFFVPDGDDLLRWTLLPAALLGLAERWRSRYWSIGPGQPLLLPMLAYTGVLVGWYLALGGFASTVRTFVSLCAFLYLSEPFLRRTDWLKYAILLAGLQLLALALYQHVVEAIPRIDGFTNPIFIGMFAFCVGTLNLFLSARSHAVLTQLAFLAASFGAFYAVAMSQTRGVAIAALVVFPLFLVFAFRHSPIVRARRRTATVLFIATTLVITAVLFTSGNIAKRFASANTDYRDWQARTEQPLSSQENGVGYRFFIWQLAWDAYLQQPFQGIGKDKFADARMQHIRAGKVSEIQQPLVAVSHAHNQYLQELVMRGIPGLLAMLLLFGALLVQGRRLVGHAPWAGYALAGITLAFLVFGLTEVTLKHPYKIYTLLMLSVAVSLLAAAPSGPRRPGVSDDA